MDGSVEGSNDLSVLWILFLEITCLFVTRDFALKRSGGSRSKYVAFEEQENAGQRP